MSFTARSCSLLKRWSCWTSSFKAIAKASFSSSVSPSSSWVQISTILNNCFARQSVFPYELIKTILYLVRLYHCRSTLFLLALLIHSFVVSSFFFIVMLAAIPESGKRVSPRRRYWNNLLPRRPRKNYHMCTITFKLILAVAFCVFLGFFFVFFFRWDAAV